MSFYVSSFLQVRNLRIGAMMRTVLPALAQAIVFNSADTETGCLKDHLQVCFSFGLVVSCDTTVHIYYFLIVLLVQHLASFYWWTSTYLKRWWRTYPLCIELKYTTLMCFPFVDGTVLLLAKSFIFLFIFVSAYLEQ